MAFGIFPAFLDHPRRIHFKEQEMDEEIELFLRQHWSVNIGWFIAAAIGYILPVFLISLDESFNFGVLESVPIKVSTGFIILFYLLVTAFVIEKLLHWYFNVYIVTNQNVVDINFYSMLSREIVEVRLQDIESQKSTVNGLKASIFGYGDVHIESASENQRIDFTAVPNPDAVADRIQDLRMKLGRKEKKE